MFTKRKRKIKNGDLAYRHVSSKSAQNREGGNRMSYVGSCSSMAEARMTSFLVTGPILTPDTYK